MKRRAFFSSIASAVAGSTAAAGSAAAQPSKPVRIGFLGAAHSHAASKIEICHKSPDWDLVGVWEADPQIAERVRGKGVRVVPRKEDLLGDASIQAIAVESEVTPHAEYAMLALEAGKHVHVEKPPALDMKGIRAMVELARRKNLKLQSGYMWRHHPGFHKIFEAVRQGWLGDVYMVRGQINTLLNPPMRVEAAMFHGGHMFELCSHLVDALIRLMGRPRKVTPFLQKAGRSEDTLLDNTAAVFEFERALGVITGAALQPAATPHRGFEVLGTNGTAVLRPIEHSPRLEIDMAKAAGPYKPGRQVVELPAYDRYVGDFAELLEAVRSGRQLNVTLDEELLVQEALLRASEMFV